MAQGEVRMQSADCRMQNAGATSGTAVEAKGLTRVYRRGAEEIRALKQVDLDVRQGELVGLVGNSGAGKTTLLNLVGLMDRPTSGALSVLGHDVTRRGTSLDALRRKNIGFVFQEFYLMPTLTALENVLLPTMWGSSGGSKKRARELLELVGLKHRMTHRPTELSGGEMQRVAIARSLINSPRLLLADEPTGNLDTKTRDEIFLLLLDLNRSSGLTVVVATHDTSLERRFTRVIRLEDGGVVERGQKSDVRS
jgi:ABC-type lipoprotein export system ATPase subunit